MSLGSDARPKYKGLTIPWVTRYVSEKKPTDTIGLVGAVLEQEETGEMFPLNIIVYADHVADDEMTDKAWADRDEDGILWMRDDGPQDGPPEFSQVHARRQSECMKKPRCQVCGGDLSGGPVPWLMSLPQIIMHTYEGKVITPNPPTCTPCQDVALAQCPHLKNGARRFLVHEYKLHSIFGDIVNERPKDGEQPVMTQEDIPVDDRRTLGMLGRQMTVEWVKFEEVSCLT